MDDEAREQGKRRLIDDVRIEWAAVAGRDLIRATVNFSTTHELDEVFRLLNNLRPTLSSHREAVAADFGIRRRHVPFSERVMEFLA